MKIIHRYIFREHIKIFLISTIFLTGILFLDKLLFLAELILSRGVTFLEVCLMMLYISPAFLAITIPISVLVASVVVFNQMSGDNEFVVMKSSGWSFLYLMRPVLAFAVIAYILNNGVIFYAVPWGNISFKQMVYNIIRHRANLDIKPNVFNHDFKNLILYAKARKGPSELEDLFVADTSTQGSNRIILSKRGLIVSDPESLKIQLRLHNGTIHNTTEHGRNYQILNFDRYDLNLALPSSGWLENEILVDNRELSLRDLWQRIKDKQKAGQPVHREQVELSKKFSIPLTCILFALAGAPLGLKSSRSGKSGGFVLCALIIVAYYVGLVSTQNLGAVGKLPSLFSVWIPNVVLLAFALFVVYKAHREIPFTFLETVIDFTVQTVEKIKNWIEAQGLKRSGKIQLTRENSDQQKEIDRRAREILQKKLQKIKTG